MGGDGSLKMEFLSWMDWMKDLWLLIDWMNVIISVYLLPTYLPIYLSVAYACSFGFTFIHGAIWRRFPFESPAIHPLQYFPVTIFLACTICTINQPAYQGLLTRNPIDILRYHRFPPERGGRQQPSAEYQNRLLKSHFCRVNALGHRYGWDIYILVFLYICKVYCSK